MKNLSLLLLLGAFASSTTACTSHQVVTREPQVNQMEEKIKALQSESGMPGLQVLVTENDKTIFEYTRGLRAEGQSEAVASTDKWHIGSCTKPMTAFLIGRLVDERKIKWTTTLAEIAPKNYMLAPSVGNITVEQLLSHSSGLADVMSPEGGKLWVSLYTDKVKPELMREKLVKGILANPVKFNPGEKFEYSNSGYVVLGWIVEQKKFDSWEHVIENEMFKPLAMNSCGFGPAGLESKTFATQPWSHEISGEKLVAIAPGLQADNPPALGPAGTVHCNVNDWQKFLRLFINNEGVRSGFLSQAVYDKLLSNAGEGPYTFSSIGRKERPWAKGTVFAMAGSNTYSFALVAIAPAMNRIFLINTNAGHAKAEESMTKILKLITELK